MKKSEQEVWNKILKMTHLEFAQLLKKAHEKAFILGNKRVPKTAKEAKEYLKNNRWIGLVNVMYGKPSRENCNWPCEEGNFIDLILWSAIYANPNNKKQLNKPMKESILNYWILNKISPHDSFKDLCDWYDPKLYPAIKKELNLKLTPEEKKALGNNYIQHQCL